MFLLGLGNLGALAQSVPTHRACPLVGPNLIVNPEFDLGNIGITSSYLFNPDYVCDWGQYSINSEVVYDPTAGCYGNPAFDIRTIWAASDRNDPGEGNYMIVDPCDPTTGGVACQALDTNNLIWSQTVPVCPLTNYIFSVNAKNLYYLEGPQYPNAGIQPQFDLFVNGEKIKDYHIDGIAIEDTVFDMPQTSVADSGVWREVSGIWTSLVGDSVAVLEIRNTQTTSGGNDLGIDGLYFGLCGLDVRLNVAGTLPQCTADGNIAPVILAASPETQASDWGYYEWYKNDSVMDADALLLPTDLIPNFTTPADPITNTYFGEYRLVVYPGIDPAISCGSSSERVFIVDSCTSITSFPVTWMGIEAHQVGDRIQLDWSTASEEQNRGFWVEMRPEAASFESIGWVPAQSNPSRTGSYRFETESLAPGSYQFRLRQVDFDGQVSLSPQVAAYVSARAPRMQLAPNPAHQQSTVTLNLETTQQVQIDLFALTGLRLASLYQGSVEAGQATPLTLDLRHVPAGVYLIQVRGQSFREQAKLMLR